ncbi:MAG TPA: FCD domain-containing protein, partial [Candidatus Dormibacteraeota bacterium]|nr:FCD domain-containing protein [Candidatus Dormibacteraeota bacterium]
GVSEEEVHQVLIPIRLTLERYSFPRAMRQMTEADLEAVENALREMELGAAAGDLKKVVETDIRFHEMVLERSGQPHTLQIWLTIEPRIRAYFHRHGRYQELRQIVRDHRELFEALRDGDEERLLGLLDKHIDVAWRP